MESKEGEERRGFFRGLGDTGGVPPFEDPSFFESEARLNNCQAIAIKFVEFGWFSTLVNTLFANSYFLQAVVNGYVM